MKNKRSESAINLSPKTNSHQPRTNRLILLISSLLVLILVSYVIWRKIQLNTAQQLVDDCSLNNNCSQIISALEKLVKARKSLTFLNLTKANLEGANLSKADLYRANFSTTNLEEANLSKANLYRANLDYANLESANLTRANLKNAILIHTKNLTPTQIKSACNWQKAYYKGRFDYEYEELIIDKQANQQFIRQLEQARASDPKQTVDCSKWKNWSQDK